MKEYEENNGRTKRLALCEWRGRGNANTKHTEGGGGLCTTLTTRYRREHSTWEPAPPYGLCRLREMHGAMWLKTI